MKPDISTLHKPDILTLQRHGRGGYLTTQSARCSFRCNLSSKFRDRLLEGRELRYASSAQSPFSPENLERHGI